MAGSLSKEFIEELNQSVRAGNLTVVQEMIAPLHAVDLADVLRLQDLSEAIAFYTIIPNELAANVLVELEEHDRKKLLNALSSKYLAKELLGNMDSDDATDIVSLLDKDKQEEVLGDIEDIPFAKNIIDLLSYPEDSAGGLMAKELIKININWDTQTSIQQIRALAGSVEELYTVYVVDDMDKLVGVVSLKKLIILSDDKRISDIYDDQVISVHVTTSQEEVALIMQKYDLVVLPVVDHLNILIGRITIDDVVDVITDEAEKDYQLASGISENVEVSDSTWMLTRARLPWLIVGLLGGLLSSRVIALYEHQLALNPEMAFFIPMIAAMGGNVGVQSSAIVVQGLANNTYKLISIGKRLFKELSVAILNGLICSVLVWIYTYFFMPEGQLGLIVSVSLAVVIFFAAIFGTVVPIVLNKYSIDPALATGPFITTINDILGLFFYFIIAHYLYAPF